MKLSELAKKEFKSYSFDDSFSDIFRVIINARDKLSSMEAPYELYVNPDYYPYYYSNMWDQACYIMRYAYAYSYEYFMIFSNIFENDVRKNGFRVLSLGCGSMIDAWAFQEAAKRMSVKEPLEYTGIDIVAWNNDFIPDTTGAIQKQFIRKKAGEFLSSFREEPYDMIFFPKSIGDMYKNDREDLLRIKHALEETVDLKDEFYIVFSLIDNEQDNKKDEIEIDYLLDYIYDRGYQGTPIWNRKVNAGICYSYPPFPKLGEDLVNDSRKFTKKHFMTSRSHEKYCICKMTKVK